MRFLALALVLSIASCSSPPPTTAFTGARVWDGTGAPVVENATIVVQDGRISSIVAGGSPPGGAEVVSLDGQFVIPGLIDAHAHVSGLWADADVEDELERIRADLDLFARYGVTTVNSLGDSLAVVAARDASMPTDARARLLAAGSVIADSDPDAARAAALANADAGVDWLKLRVDDNLGTGTKMPWDAVQAVIEAGTERGLETATHLYYLEDAKRLLEIGSGLIAHSVRDTFVDDEFLELLRDTGVCYVPTLTRELSTFIYSIRPAFFDDPFFTEHAQRSEVERLSDPNFMAQVASSPAAAGYERALQRALSNLKTVTDAGLPVAMGTDAGVAARFPGYFEHLELWMMVDAGLTPEQSLASATRVAAECLGLDDRGTLEPGKWADFLVLGADPFDSIEATRELEAVYIAGNIVP